jgi:hypothetical protein
LNPFGLPTLKKYDSSMVLSYPPTRITRGRLRSSTFATCRDRARGGEALVGDRTNAVGSLHPGVVPTIGVELLHPIDRRRTFADLRPAIGRVADRAQQLSVIEVVLEVQLHLVLTHFMPVVGWPE